MRFTGKPLSSFENLGAFVDVPYVIIAWSEAAQPLQWPPAQNCSPVPSWALPDIKFDQSPSQILAAGNTHCESRSLLKTSVKLYRTLYMRVLVWRHQFCLLHQHLHAAPQAHTDNEPARLFSKLGAE